MKNIINFEMLKILKRLKKMTPEQLRDALCSEELRSDMIKNCDPDEMSMIMHSDNISGRVAAQISKVISKKHGTASEANPPTVERRNDYYHLCLYVASHIFSRALAMYEPQDRDGLLEEFRQLSYTEAALMRHEVDMKYTNDTDTEE